MVGAVQSQEINKTALARQLWYVAVHILGEGCGTTWVKANDHDASPGVPLDNYNKLRKLELLTTSYFKKAVCLNV